MVRKNDKTPKFSSGIRYAVCSASPSDLGHTKKTREGCKKIRPHTYPA